MTEITARNQGEWEAWLEANHETAPEVWLVYWKKASGEQSIAWAEAVEVALKFGWIDGLMRPIDETRYAQRWTPRRPKSKWSKVNKEIALRHIASGEMRPMGLAAVEAGKSSGEWDRAYTVQPATPVPEDLKARLTASRAAREQQRRVSRTRWERWLAWLSAAEGVARTRRLNAIVKALETKDYAAADAAARRFQEQAARGAQPPGGGAPRTSRG